jgi:hypothetical protein
VAGHLGLTDPNVCSWWLVLLTTAASAGVWIYWAPLLRALTENISTAPAQALAVLSPGFGDYQTQYRLALSIVVGANVALWYRLVRACRMRQARLAVGITAAEVAILALLVLSMQVPYRLIRESDQKQFKTVYWRQYKCYILGSRAADSLLFCPGASSRLRIVPTASEPLVEAGLEESIFTDFAAPPTR